MRSVLIILLCVLLKLNGVAQIYPLSNFHQALLPVNYSPEQASLDLSNYPRFPFL